MASLNITYLLDCISFSPATAKMIPEKELLLVILKKDTERIVSFRERGFDSGLFWKLALRCDFAGTTYSLLKQAELTSVLPDRERRLFQDAYLIQCVKCEQMFSKMAALKCLFARHGLNLVFLKGVLLSDELYGDITNRKILDIDILVRREKIGAVDAVFEEASAQKIFGMPQTNFMIDYALHHFRYGFMGELLEVHWRMSCFPLFKIEEDGLWNSAQEITVRNEPFRVLSNEHALLLHLLSIFSDLQIGQPRYKNYLDGYVLLKKTYPDIDWPDFFTHRKKEKTFPICINMLRSIITATASEGEFPLINDCLKRDKKLIAGLKVQETPFERVPWSRFFADKIRCFGLYGVPYYKAMFWWLTTLGARIKGYK